MRVIAGGAERGPVVSLAIVMASLMVLTFAVVTDFGLEDTAPVIVLLALAVAAHRTLLQWHALLAFLILVIAFIPVKRYSLPGDLPVDLEPYRLTVALIAAAWLSSLLIDPRVRLRRTGLEGPILLVVIAVLGSIAANGERVSALGDEGPLKAITFLASFFLLFYVIVSVMRTLGPIEFVVKPLVLGGSIIAVLAIIESRTNYNPFNNLDGVVPLLQLDEFSELPEAGRSRLRAYGPAQHPIALGAFLVMLIPLALYLAKAKARSRALWLSAAGVLLVGALATVSRTTIPMLIAIGLVFLWLRPRETKRLWPALIPALIVVHFALPGTLGTLRASFFPREGLIEEQRQGGRVEDLGPSMREFAEKPLLGQGYATRVVTGKRQNADVLDDQWLKTLLETGAVGFLAWLWLFVRFLRRAGSEARKGFSDEDWFLAAVAAAVAAYAVGMFFYDAFSFIQVTFLLYILLGFGAAILSRRARAAFPN
jgi:hypothetical protein